MIETLKGPISSSSMSPVVWVLGENHEQTSVHLTHTTDVRTKKCFFIGEIGGGQGLLYLRLASYLLYSWEWHWDPDPSLSLHLLNAGDTGVVQHTWCHVVLGNERRALCMLGKHATSWVTLPNAKEMVVSKSRKLNHEFIEGGCRRMSNFWAVSLRNPTSAWVLTQESCIFRFPLITWR